MPYVGNQQYQQHKFQQKERNRRFQCTDPKDNHCHQSEQYRHNQMDQSLMLKETNLNQYFFAEIVPLFRS